MSRRRRIRNLAGSSGIRTETPYFGLTMGKLTGTASLLRRAGRTTRRAASSAAQGTPATWQAHLSIAGLSDQRREELVQGLMEAFGSNDRLESRDDGLLHIDGQVQARSLGTAFSHALAQFSTALREAGMKPDEMTSNLTNFALTPRPDIATSLPSNTRQRLGERLARSSHGLGVAAAELFDMDTRQQLGDREIPIRGALLDLDGAAASRISDFLIAADGAKRNLSDGTLALQIETDKVGGPIGALLLASRQLDRLLSLTNARASLRLTAFQN